MVEHNIALLKKDLQEMLYLDLDDFGLETEQHEILSHFIGLRLQSEFQPIQDIRSPNITLGFEAILRPAIGDNAVNVAFAFSLAEKQGKLVKLDRVVRTLHLLNYLHLPSNRGLLFVRVHPNLLANVTSHGKVFERILHTRSIPTRQVVIEIADSQGLDDALLVKAVRNYRDCGYRIGLDIYGCRRSNFDRIWKISPDYVKLDARIITRAQNNIRAQRILPKLIGTIQNLKAQVIVSGIASEAQYNIAKESGAVLLQGNFIGTARSANGWKTQLERSTNKNTLSSTAFKSESLGVRLKPAFQYLQLN